MKNISQGIILAFIIIVIFIEAFTENTFAQDLSKINNPTTLLVNNIDSIKTKLTTITTQINILNSKLTAINVNTTKIIQEIEFLNQQFKTLQTELKSILLNPNSDVVNLLDGLVAYYPFSGNAGDSSGNGNHGTVFGATLTTDRFGKSSKAYSFDESNLTYISGSCTNYPSGNMSRSISFWYYAENLGNNISHQVLGYGGGSCLTSFIMNFENKDIGSNKMGKYEVQGHCLAFRNFTDLPSPYNNQWHNITVTYDNGVLRFYNNGILNFTSNSLTMNTFVSGKIFAIGREVTPDGSAVYIDPVWPGFKGKLDDIRIYNRSLNQEEISYIATH